MKTNNARRSTRKSIRTFAPTAWQWDPASVTSENVQWWSASGSMMGLVPLAKAREMVASRSFFVGAANYICEVHDGIDGRHAA